MSNVSVLVLVVVVVVVVLVLVVVVLVVVNDERKKVFRDAATAYFKV